MDILMDTVFWVVGVLLICFSIFVVYTGIVRQVHNYRHSKNGDGSWSSPTPLIGTLAFIGGYAILPIEFSYWAFLIVLFDIDTPLILVGLILFIFHKSDSD